MADLPRRLLIVTLGLLMGLGTAYATADTLHARASRAIASG